MKRRVGHLVRAGGQVSGTLRAPALREVGDRGQKRLQKQPRVWRTVAGEKGGVIIEKMIEGKLALNGELETGSPASPARKSRLRRG